MIRNKSPLRYPGGKTRACKVLDSILVKYFNMDEIEILISPFIGGGSFEFYLQNKYGIKIIANDKFTPLYSFWYCVKKHKKTIAKCLYSKIGSINKELFIDYRNRIMNETDIKKQAVMFFIINRCSFSGATLSGGFSKESSVSRFTTSSIDRIDKLDLSQLKIRNWDFTKFIKKYDNRKKRLIFLDPPYYLMKKSKLYGVNGDLHEKFDHEKLAKILENKTGWTYNNCEYIQELYKKFVIIPVDWKYGMNKSKESSEIVILSSNIS
uniref:site-specific DNA-methyltransferase (adenine-specific) n=1 Tax=viral metagenome TaxID=1070528 RepID=A0A6C0IU96_9ZZZZ